MGEREDVVSQSRIPARESTPPQFWRPYLRPIAIVVLAALVGVVAWLILRPNDESTPAGEATAYSADGLRARAAQLDQPLYWIGALENRTYELTRAPTGFYLRYLPEGVDAGDPQPALTVGTYPMVNAYAVLQDAARRPGATTYDVPPGGIGVINKARPSSAYVAFPGSNFQIEIFAPKSSVAAQLASSGRVRPVVANAASQGLGPVAVSPQRLRALAKSLGHPVYWAGPRRNTTYELTQTANGWTYVRYLPRQVDVGAKGGYLTIATYPVKDAFTVMQRGARDATAVRIDLPNGGIAVYPKRRGTNVHLAFPGTDAQGEVYDPNPSVPPQILAQGQVVPVG
jgi:hypothetical protein